MATNFDRFKSDLDKLVARGSEMQLDLYFRDPTDKQIAAIKGVLKKENSQLLDRLHRSFENNYQRWYSESCAVLQQVLPDRVDEFAQLYRGNGKRKSIDAITYCIQDWLNGVTAATDNRTGVKFFNDFAIVAMRFNTQIGIVKAAQQRFETSLYQIAQLVRADLFDSELEAARELTSKGFLRGAGAIAGVVMEKHLAQIAQSHAVVLRKQHPTISDLNDILKASNVIDVPTWRQIQKLGDIRNLCDHNKKREPTSEEVVELIDGVDKVCKTLF